MSATNAKLDAEKHRPVVQLMGLHRPRDVVSADARASVFQVLLSMRWAYPNISAAVQQELYRLCASRLVSPGAGDLPLFNVCHAVRPLTADQVRKRVGVTVSVRHMRGFRVSRPDVSPRPCPEWPSRATGAATSPRSRGQGGNPHVLTGSRPSVCVPVLPPTVQSSNGSHFRCAVAGRASFAKAQAEDCRLRGCEVVSFVRIAQALNLVRVVSAECAA